MQFKPSVNLLFIKLKLQYRIIVKRLKRDQRSICLRLDGVTRICCFCSISFGPSLVLWMRWCYEEIIWWVKLLKFCVVTLSQVGSYRFQLKITCQHIQVEYCKKQRRRNNSPFSTRIDGLFSRAVNGISDFIRLIECY